MIHISLDLETFGKQPDASIASIGAVAWEEGSPKHEEIYIVVDDPLGSFDPDTLRWHASNERTLDCIGRSEVALPLPAALRLLGGFLSWFSVNEEGAAAIWSHATFDIPILNSAYKRGGMGSPPWHYRNTRDLRTLYDLAGGRPDLPDIGTAHHALDDAKYQAEEVRECLRRVRE